MKNPLDFFRVNNYNKITDKKNINNPVIWGKYILISYEIIYLKKMSQIKNINEVFDNILHDLLLMTYEINNKDNFKYNFTINKNNFTIIYDNNLSFKNEYNAFQEISNISDIKNVAKNHNIIKETNTNNLSVLDIETMFKKVQIIKIDSNNEKLIDDIGNIYFSLREELKDTFDSQHIDYYTSLIVALLLFQLSSSSYNLDASLNIKTKDNEDKQVFLYSFSEHFKAESFNFNVKEYDGKTVEHIYLDHNEPQETQNLHMGRVYAALDGNENIVKMNIQKKDGEVNRIDLLVEI